MVICYRPMRGIAGVVYEQVGSLDFCCEEMGNEWGILVGFGVRGHRRTTSREVNLFTFHPGSAVWGITEVRHCPWCGAEIELVRVS